MTLREHVAGQDKATSLASALLRGAWPWFAAMFITLMAAGAPAAVVAAPPADHCPSPITVGTPAAAISTPVVLRILPSTYWQPVGGDIKFELRGVRQPPTALDVYFVWKDIPSRPGSAAESGDGNTLNPDRLAHCRPSGRVIQIDSMDPAGSDLKTFTYAARVPDLDLKGEGLLGIEGLRHWSWSGLVPQADFYVSATVPDDATPGKLVTIMLPATVGVTTPWLAFLIAGVAFLVGGYFLSRWSISRCVQGDPLLRIISTPTGVASLSQFQIIAWTAVIGTGVLYVMMLSGNLIDVPGSTLELLGVTGFTLVASALITGTDGSAQRASLPGIAGAVAVFGEPSESEVTLTWSPPADATQAISYIVESRQDATSAWVQQGSGIGVPPYPVVGLQAGTAYAFRVLAVYASGGPGPASAIVSTRTAEKGAAVPPRPTVDLKAEPAPDANVSLVWDAHGGHTIEYRKAGTQAWTTYATNAASPRLTKGNLFDYATAYEFQVFSVHGQVVSATSNIAPVTTIPRRPLWSDLVMSGRASTEVDMARVQMLIFTSIAAAFSAITIINIGEIPTIPGGELALIGLSNGVYLSSKAVRDKGNANS